MNILLGLLSGFATVLFWAAVLSFVPITIFFILHPLHSVMVERNQGQGIFVLSCEDQLRREIILRNQGVGSIYGVCVFLFSLVYLWAIPWKTNPFNILSVFSVILFWFAILTYLPVVLYLTWKVPWKYKEEGVFLSKLFVSYGAGILIFSIIYSFFWLKEHNILMSTKEILSSFAIVVFAAAAFSYLPVLLYFLLKASHSHGMVRVVRLNVVFVIYSICFFVFSLVYIINWLSIRQIFLFGT